MDTNIVIAHHHINLVRALKDYHIRHYIWEISKVLIPVFITGLITVVVMRGNENRNKKRWLNDGHIKRKTELEIEIRKFLLCIKAHASHDYSALAVWNKNNNEMDTKLICDFNKSFENLFEYLKNQENKNESNNSHYKKIFAIIDEYLYYDEKANNIFNEFKVLYQKILELKTIYRNDNSNTPGNRMHPEMITIEVNERPEHFDEMINTYLCFMDVIEKILKKLTIKKI